MATQCITFAPGTGLIQSSWSALVGSENGDAASIAHWADKTVQASGTFTSITMQGSNDLVSWFTLNDPQGVDMVFAAAGLQQIQENPRYVRPVSVGAGAGCVVIVVGNSN